MKFMKRMLILAMALCMALGCAGGVSAATSPSGGKTPAPTPAPQKPVVVLKENNITAKATRTAKKVKLKKKNVTFKINAKASSNTAITYKKVWGCKYIKVTKSGKVIVKKNIFKKCKGKDKKRKVHRIKVRMTAAAGNGYKSVTKTIILKVKIK